MDVEFNRFSTVTPWRGRGKIVTRETDKLEVTATGLGGNGHAVQHVTLLSQDQLEENLHDPLLRWKIVDDKKVVKK